MKQPSMQPLHVCPACSSDLVYPIQWKETADWCWIIELRCPNCEWCERGKFLHEDVEEFDHILCLGTDMLIDDLEMLSRVNFEADIERIAYALEHDHLLPEDF